MENSAHRYTEGSEPTLKEEIERLESENERLRQAYKYIHASRNNVDEELNNLQKELASLKEENAKLKGLLKESHKALEYGELELRTTYKRFTRYKGSSSLWTMQEMIEKLKPFSDNKINLKI